MTNTQNILIIVTNADEFDNTGLRTGLWLSELVHFFEVAEKAGYHMDIASPLGGEIPLDPQSLIIPHLTNALGLTGKLTKRYKDKNFRTLLNNTLKISAADVNNYDAIYLTGGHGLMFDFTENETLAKLIANFYEAGKIVSAVCHGSAGLLNVKLSNGQYLVYGKNVSGFSWNEEKLARLDKAVPYNLEEELKKRRANYSKALLPFGSHVVVDGQLITGQNPISAKGVGKAVVNLLDKSK